MGTRRLFIVIGMLCAHQTVYNAESANTRDLWKPASIVFGNLLLKFSHDVPYVVEKDVIEVEEDEGRKILIRRIIRHILPQEYKGTFCKHMPPLEIKYLGPGYTLTECYTSQDGAYCILKYAVPNKDQSHIICYKKQSLDTVENIVPPLQALSLH